MARWGTLCVLLAALAASAIAVSLPLELSLDDGASFVRAGDITVQTSVSAREWGCHSAHGNC